MIAVSLRTGLARSLDRARSGAASLAIFSGTLFLSALLLFSVQPVFAKMVLPKLGGSPSVWAVSMVFFQAVLLAGYCYAHLLNRFVAPRQAPFLHLCLLGVAVLALPFGLPSNAAEPPAGDAYFWLIGVLAMGVGLPFFAVSANAPLLQSWFARTGDEAARDPYFLYGASNLGSLIALLGYPLAIEPVLGLSTQAAVWTKGFVLLGLLIAVCGLLMATAVGTSDTSQTEAHDLAPAAPLTRGKRAAWIFLAAVPSGLLVAFTSYLTTDIASAPFLWVIPLAVFLATFILVFRDRPMIPHKVSLIAQPVCVALAMVGLSLPGNKGWTLAAIFGFASFFFSTLVAHKELYDQRPDSRNLTEFYLWMSFGGVLGGIFAALVAPQLFNSIFEFPLLLVAGLLCRPGVAAAFSDRAERLDAGLTTLMMFAVLVALFAAIRLGAIPPALAVGGAAFAVVGLALMTMVSLNKPAHLVGIATPMAIALVALPSPLSKGTAERSFFGVHRVSSTPEGDMRLLLHGTTVHGAERVRDADGKPVTAALPATYYYPGSPMARGVDAARAASGKAPADFRAGIVGLGAGSLACYAKPEENWRFFEIDPVVVKLARDPKTFTFLSRCRPAADVVLGDARLTVAKEKSASFDYLVIDAFSSDAVPVHLLTREAVQLYLDRLTETGILALHVSNRHMDLASVASSVARSVPGAVVALADNITKVKTFDEASSHVVLVAKSRDALKGVLAWRDVTEITAVTVTPWTDDYSDIVGSIWRNYKALNDWK
jgi:spermidine synthase